MSEEIGTVSSATWDEYHDAMRSMQRGDHMTRAQRDLLSREIAALRKEVALSRARAPREAEAGTVYESFPEPWRDLLDRLEMLRDNCLSPDLRDTTAQHAIDLIRHLNCKPQPPALSHALEAGDETKKADDVVTLDRATFGLLGNVSYLGLMLANEYRNGTTPGISDFDELARHATAVRSWIMPAEYAEFGTVAYDRDWAVAHRAALREQFGKSDSPLPASPAARPETAERDKAVMALGEAKWAHHAFCWGLGIDDQHQRLSEMGDIEKLRRLNELADAVENALETLRSLSSRSPAAPEATQENKDG